MRHAARRLAALGAIITMILAGFAQQAPPRAHAVSATGFTITVSPNTEAQYATYTLGNFRTGNAEEVVGYRLTLPAGVDASGAASSGTGDSVTVAADNATVTVALGTSYPRRTSFGIQLSNIRNPAPGAHVIADVLFYLADGSTQTVSLKPKDGTFTIVSQPYISMTITTPDVGQTVDFGTVDPGVASGPRQVTVTVVSSADYTITRTPGGSFGELGLSITGTAAGPKTAGTSTWVDDYVLTPLWTTDPGAPLTATVVYTVTQ